jgi:hypothetical protein
MKKKGWILALMTMVLLSCSKKRNEENTYQTYIINKGEHQSNHDFQDVITDSVISFNVIFDSTAVYKSTEDENEEDVNKLYGISDCGIMHHMNSARIGWRWLNNSLELFAYSYSNGIRSIERIGEFEINKELKCAIYCVKNKYVFEVNGQKVETKRSCDISEHYLLYPYFGGNNVAPHKIKIKIAHLSKKH